MSAPLARQEIIDRAGLLPAFPRVVNDILATLEDDNATIHTLAQQVERDPVVTARVLSLANSASLHSHPGAAIRDVATATSMIGMARVREIVLGVSLAQFARGSRVSQGFWEHSVAVGVCAQELAHHARLSLDCSLVAGLLHDIGQLWLERFHPLECQQVKLAMARGDEDFVAAERKYFGLDHGEVGLVLAEHWGLPEPLKMAIAGHHQPEAYGGEKLVGAIHVANALANGLDLPGRPENRVTALSAAASAALGLDWSQDLHSLFGRLEARTAYACSVFR